MFLNSFDFLLFFIVVFFFQWFLPHRPRNIFLLAASYFFYGYWDWRFLALVVFSTLVDYHCGLAIEASADAFVRKRYVVVSLLVNLGVLGFFKYANFFIGSVENLMTLTGIHVSPWHLNIILPLGISFYIFRSMGYVIDVYRGQMKATQNLINYALFLAFFPQMIAGPIERSGSLLPQFQTKPRISLGSINIGVWLILWGLFKKAVIADNLAVIVNKAFSDTTALSGADALIAVYAYSLQIYADFSGYTDMARGCAKCLGYESAINFNLPYFAASPRDFWRRWHISLSTWFRDYLYIPLGGSRSGEGRTYVNLFLTMLLCGLWHGASWNFVIWGGYHGVLLMLNRLVIRSSFHFIPESWNNGRAWTVVKVFGMFNLISFGWIIFRADSLANWAGMMQALTGGFLFSTVTITWVWQIAVLCAPLLFVQLLQAASRDPDILLKLSVFPRAFTYAIILSMLLTLGSFGSTEFIYARF